VVAETHLFCVGVVDAIAASRSVGHLLIFAKAVRACWLILCSLPSSRVVGIGIIPEVLAIFLIARPHVAVVQSASLGAFVASHFDDLSRRLSVVGCVVWMCGVDCDVDCDAFVRRMSRMDLSKAAARIAPSQK